MGLILYYRKFKQEKLHLPSGSVRVMLAMESDNGVDSIFIKIDFLKAPLTLRKCQGHAGLGVWHWA